MSEKQERKITIEKELATHIEGEVARQLKTKHLTEKAIVADVEEFQEKLRLHHKVIYAALVFFGVVLIWYGLWTVIPDIPVVKNPLLAMPVGAVILAATGAWYRKTAG